MQSDMDSESRGSSVSSGLKDEYEELIRGATVKTFSTESGIGVIGSGDFSRITSLPQEPIQGTSEFVVGRLTSTPRKSSGGGGEEAGTRDTPSKVGDSVDQAWDMWSIPFKQHLAAQFREWKLHFLQKHTEEMAEERQKHERALTDMKVEVRTLREQLRACDKSLQRKDAVIQNLTDALTRQKERARLAKTFGTWKSGVDQDKAELRQQKPREVVASAAQETGAEVARMKETLSQLEHKAIVERADRNWANVYRRKIASLTKELAATRADLAREREAAQESQEHMRSAIMRGITALNYEASNIFTEDDLPRHPRKTREKEKYCSTCGQQVAATSRTQEATCSCAVRPQPRARQGKVVFARPVGMGQVPGARPVDSVSCVGRGTVDRYLNMHLARHHAGKRV